MNYGYDSSCRGWKDTRKQALAEAISKELIIAPGYDLESDPNQPYVEVDGLYRGVRIRRITHLTETERERILKKADEIYLRIMENK